MKVLALCPACENPVSVSKIELPDNGIIVSTCKNGHRFKTIFQNPKFELLFESGALALIDGYPREAVSSFASALERFFEFYQKGVAHILGISDEDITGTWAGMSKSSERQLGSFLMSYLLFNRKSVSNEFLRSFQTKASFRNNVIHNGYMPTESESRQYGEYVHKTVVDFALELYATGENHAIKAFFRDLISRDKGEQAPNESQVSTYLSTVLSILNLEIMASNPHTSDMFNFEGRMKDLEKKMDYMYGNKEF